MRSNTPTFSRVVVPSITIGAEGGVGKARCCRPGSVATTAGAGTRAGARLKVSPPQPVTRYCSAMLITLEMIQ